MIVQVLSRKHLFWLLKLSNSLEEARHVFLILNLCTFSLFLNLFFIFSYLSI